MSTVRQLGEFGLIARLARQLGRTAQARRAGVAMGIGDDCAVLRAGDPRRRLLYTCDPVVEGVHYLAGTPPYRIGWKAMARNLSDVAAMGGQPRWAVVSLGLRPGTKVADVAALYRGLTAAARRFGGVIVGGDTTHVRREPFVVVALVGEVEPERLVTRAGARPGDVLLVTGALGGSLRGRHLRFTPRVHEARWLTAHYRLRAMIDLSDGLSSDLQRLVEAGRGRVGFELDAAAIPVAAAARGRLAAALNDGEDFELLFAIDRRVVTELQRRWRRAFPRTRLSVIGRVTRASGQVTLVARDGTRRPLRASGYDHFRRH